MVKTTTESGFYIEIPEEKLDDMELLDALVEMATNPLAVSKVADLILGEKKKELYEHLRQREGHVRITSVEKVIEEIFKAGGQQIKNS